MASTESELAAFAEPQGVLVSQLETPVTVAVGDGHIRLPARGKTGLLVKSSLGALPEGVFFVPHN